jgi:hypothetical protein
VGPAAGDGLAELTPLVEVGSPGVGEVEPVCEFVGEYVADGDAAAAGVLLGVAALDEFRLPAFDPPDEFALRALFDPVEALVLPGLFDPADEFELPDFDLVLALPDELSRAAEFLLPA